MIRHPLAHTLNDLTEAMLTRQAARDRARAERRLLAPLRRWWTAQGRSFLVGLAPLRHEFSEAITPEDWDPIWDQTSAATAPLIEAVIDTHAAATYETGARHTIAEVGIDVDFDLDNARAVRFLETRGAEFVTRVDATTRAELRTLLVQATDEGWSWQRTGRAIRAKFDGFGGRGPMGKHLRNRAELVAVNETAEAYEAGNQAIRDQLTAQGLEVEKRWVTSRDDRVTQGCLDNEGDGWIPDGSSFSGGGFRAPRFVGCRCVTTTRVAPAGDEEA